MSFWIAYKTFQDKDFQLDALRPLAHIGRGRAGVGYGLASQQVEQVVGEGACHHELWSHEYPFPPCREQTDRHDGKHLKLKNYVCGQ